MPDGRGVQLALHADAHVFTSQPRIGALRGACRVRPSGLATTRFSEASALRSRSSGGNSFTRAEPRATSVQLTSVIQSHSRARRAGS